jgi:hypothetical protein
VCDVSERIPFDATAFEMKQSIEGAFRYAGKVEVSVCFVQYSSTTLSGVWCTETDRIQSNTTFVLFVSSLCPLCVLFVLFVHCLPSLCTRHFLSIGESARARRSKSLHLDGDVYVGGA